MLTTHNIDIQAMLVWLTLHFYDFCGFDPSPLTLCINCSFFKFIKVYHSLVLPCIVIFASMPAVILHFVRLHTFSGFLVDRGNGSA